MYELNAAYLVPRIVFVPLASMIACIVFSSISAIRLGL